MTALHTSVRVNLRVADLHSSIYVFLVEPVRRGRLVSSSLSTTLATIIIHIQRGVVFI